MGGNFGWKAALDSETHRDNEVFLFSSVFCNNLKAIIIPESLH